ncbi:MULTISPECIES: structural protein P5 [Alistipes]|uniref:structural protein P5 n=1 Tax=Alistipes TaxID=239759 RepID=UPI001B3821E9|nr:MULTISPECIES: structural protein P5 [Alistipes]MBQ4902315.1 structural protein P5 [Alistipes sp. Marseille-P2263]MCI2257589.1 structural protein P5 [Alistipes dispar]
MTTRGIRNCNPGNIRNSKTKYLGEVRPSRDAAFKQFETMAWGYRAMFVLLHTYSRNGYRTLRQMITRYAPPVENHTENYIAHVSRWAEVFPDASLDTLDPAVMISVVGAMSRMENGVPAVDSDVREGWRLFMQHKP